MSNREHHLKPLFVIGPPSSGKSHYIQELAVREGRNLLHCPCRKDRTLREQRSVIHEWALRAEPTLLWLEGADDLTPEAQSFLRRILETYAQHVRFCLEARSIESIQEPILSRCNIMRLKAKSSAELRTIFSRKVAPTLIADLEKYVAHPSYRQYSMAASAAVYFPELWEQKKKGAAKCAEYTLHSPLGELYMAGINPWDLLWAHFDGLDKKTKEIFVNCNLNMGNPWSLIHYIAACGKVQVDLTA